MNPLKSNKFIALFIGMLAFVGLALIVAFTSNDLNGNPEEDAIIECIQQAQTIEVNIGAVPTDILTENHKKGTETMLSEEQAQQVIDDYDQQLSAVFTQNYEKCLLASEESVISLFTQYSFDEMPTFDVQLDAGCLSYKKESIIIDGNTATADGTTVVWTKYIKRDNDAGRYMVILGYSRCFRTDTLILRNDTWLIDTENYDLEFAPDNYDHNKGTYDTFEKAVTAASKLDPAAENPF